ncbi:MAG: hypothetical protein AAGE52_02055, partial [Myxococcota bacterium]
MNRWAGLLLVVLGCGGGSYVVETPDNLVLQTNLRADARGIMSSVQRWSATRVVPVCTPVRILRVSRREIRFEDQAGNRYRYILHRSTRLPVEEHINRYFGQGCPNTQQMSAVDQQGIQTGQALPGMTKTGVVLALGYPPEHRTPTLDGPVWTYWGQRKLHRNRSAL